MFEKEAEEWFEKLKQAKVPYTYENVNEQLHKAFIEGAEIGYNKANEWHFVKDSDLPKETDILVSETLQLITKMKGTDNLNLVLGKYNFASQKFSYSHIMGLTDVIAWKEIVLPKEIAE